MRWWLTFLAMMVAPVAFLVVFVLAPLLVIFVFFFLLILGFAWSVADGITS